MINMARRHSAQKLSQALRVSGSLLKPKPQDWVVVTSVEVTDDNRVDEMRDTGKNDVG